MVDPSAQVLQFQRESLVWWVSSRHDITWPQRFTFLFCLSQQLRCFDPIELEGSLTGIGKIAVDLAKRLALGLVRSTTTFSRVARELNKSSPQYCGIEFAAIFGDQADGTAQERGVDEARDALGAVIDEGVEADVAPGFSIKWGDFIDGKNITLWIVGAAFDVEDLYAGSRVVPKGELRIHKIFWVGGEL